jgi:hypothetical protein
MRVLLGLVALAATTVNAATPFVTPQGVTYGNYAVQPPVGTQPQAQIQVQLQVVGGSAATVTPSLASTVSATGYQNSNNWVIYTANSVANLNFAIVTNQYTGQVQYRWAPNYPSPAAAYPNAGFSSQTYTCDPCSGGNPITCNSATGPGASPSPLAGFQCASLTRNFYFTNLTPSQLNTVVINSFSFQLFDIVTNPAPNVSSYSFTIVRATSQVVGDPQIVGMQGQDFQVHGMPDEIFNMVSYPTVQINSRFTYLESGACHDNFTACFAHPGTYISEEGFRIGKDKVRVTAGSFKKGLTVSVNGKKITSNVDLKSGAVQIVNHRRVIVHTEIMKVTVSNSDHFINQELELQDSKLVALGGARKVLKDNERFHPEVPLHGLQGQTWRNVEYASGLEYEGSIMDYHVVDGNLFGTDFAFNQFSS